MNKREMIAMNIAGLLYDGDFVNLGVGMPTLVGNFIPEGMLILLHGENGSIGQDKELPLKHLFQSQEKALEWMRAHGDDNGDWRTGHRDLSNAGCGYITMKPGGFCVDSSMAFAMARGGHLDVTVLGGLQVDEKGNLANWMVPGKAIKGMGGAMDLVCGAKKVIVAMEHCTKNGEPKIVKECTMPLTAVNCVNTVVTELCIIEFIEGEPVVKAMAKDISKEELIEKTGARITFAENIEIMKSA